MSSEPARRLAAGRCLFCSLGCRLALEPFGPQRWRPRWNGGDGTLCARGQMLADLLHSPHRLYRPRLAGREATWDAARDWLHEAAGARPDARLALWLDGSAALEDLAAARALAASRPEHTRLVVHLLPWELGACAGLDDAGAAQADPQRWTEADGLLVVGNPAATHPPAARWLLRRGAARARTPLVLIDASAGVLATFTAHALLGRPGCECWLTAAVLRAAGADASGWPPEAQADALERAVRDSGVAPAAVERAAGRLRELKRPAVVIAPQAGTRENWRAVSALAARWAQARGGMASVLTSAAGALGVTRYVRRHRLDDWWSLAAAGQATPADLLLVIGWDPTTAYPRSLWEPMFAAARRVALASAFPPAEPEAYAACLPLALGPEAGGHYLLASGALEPNEPLLPPPAGVLTVPQLLAQVAGAGAVGVAGGPAGEAAALRSREVAPLDAEPLAALPQPPPVRPDPWPAALIADPMQYFDGQITGRAAWTQRARALPELRLAPADAERLGVREGQEIWVRNAQGRASVRVTLAPGQPAAGACYGEGSNLAGQRAGWLALAASAPAVRRLLPLRFGQMDAAAAAGLVAVDLDVPAAPRSVPEEATRARG